MGAERARTTLGELGARVGGRLLSGDAEREITGVSGLAEAGPSELSFYGNARYKKALASTRAGAVLVAGEVEPKEGTAFVQVANPHLAFAKISALFHPAQSFEPGIRPGAFVHPEAEVHPEAAVFPCAVVERAARVGAGAVLMSGAYVGEGARIGEGTLLYPNAVVRERCLVGARVILHAGAVVGADGFGFAFDPEVPEHFKIPQAGIVRVEDDVEIGACSTVDRATLGETVIGRGTKIDNLVQIAHNVKVGPLGILCAQVGVAGSAELGGGIVLGGQAGVTGHVRVGDLVKVGPRGGIMHDAPDGAVLSGMPAIPHNEWLRAATAYAHLGELVREVRALRRRLDALEKERKP